MRLMTIGLAVLVVVVGMDQAAGEGILIPVPTRSDHVYDPLRGLLCISTSEGTIERYDPGSNTMLPSWSIGASLSGVDVSPDGMFLYVGERHTTPSAGFVRKVNLDDGTKTNLAYPISGSQGGVKDIAIANNGKALFSISFNGSGSVPLWELDLASETFTSPRAVSQNEVINRAADRSLLFLHDSNSHPDTIFTYDPSTGTFPASDTVDNIIGGHSAVNRNGSLIALWSFSDGLSIPSKQILSIL